MLKGITSILKRIFASKILLGLFLLPFIKPPQEITGNIDSILDVVKFATIAFILVSYIIIRKKPSKIIAAITALQLVFLISTALSGGRLLWGAVQFISILGICALFELSFIVNREKWLRPFAFVLFFASLAVTISMIVSYPNGLYQVTSGDFTESSNYLWGFDNYSAFSFIASFAIIAVDSGHNKKKIVASLLLMLFALFAFFYVGSLAASVCIALFLIAYLMVLLSAKFKKVINARVLLPVSLVVFICIFAAGHISPVYTLLENVGKSGSFSSRIILWKKTVKQSAKSPVIGYGFEDIDATREKLYFDHPHNIFLDILYRGGIIGLLFFMLLLMLVLKAGKAPSLDYCIASAGLFSVFCCGLLDYYNQQYLIFPLYLLAYYHVPGLFCCKKKDKASIPNSAKTSFSIIIPTFNSESTIKNCINSVLDQDYNNFEIIVINDGSTDKTESAVKTLKDDRIQYVRTENMGVGHARNTGLKMSKNDWVIFLDDDDTLAPASLSRLSNAISIYNPDHIASPIDDAHSSAENVLYAGEKRLTIMNDYISPDKAMMYEDSRVVPLRGIGGKVYRRAVINKHHLSFSEDLKKFEDGLFNIYFSFYSESTLVMGDCFYRYNLNDGSISKRKHSFELSDNKIILGEIEKFTNKNHLSKTNINYLAFSMFYDALDILYSSGKKELKKQIDNEIDFYGKYLVNLKHDKYRIDKKLALKAAKRRNRTALLLLAKIRKPLLRLRGRD